MLASQKRLISINITIGKYNDFLKRIGELARDRISSYVCVANVHMLIEAHKNKDFQKVVNNADLVTPDGMPLAKGLEIIYDKKQDRVAGMDLLPDLLNLAEKENQSVFFYGGTEKMLETTRLHCTSHYPDLKIAGLISPPFRELTLDEEKEIITAINATGANFVFVALGCPKQEKWMASMKGKINACMLGIGGAVPVMVGLQKRAPKYLQKLSWNGYSGSFRNPNVSLRDMLLPILCFYI